MALNTSGNYKGGKSLVKYSKVGAYKSKVKSTFKYIAKKHWFTVLYQMGCNFVLHSNWGNTAILIYMTIVTQFVPKRGASSSELTSMETRPFLF